MDINHLDEAYGLCRSLVECSLILRFLTRDIDKQLEYSTSFIHYTSAYKNYWLHWARENTSGTIDQEEVERLAQDFRFSGDPSGQRKGWIDRKLFNSYSSQTNTHPTDGQWFNLDVRTMAYASDYYDPSQYVHCSQPALDNFFPEPGVPFVVEQSKQKFFNDAGRIAFIVAVYLHHVVRYALYGLQIGGAEEIDELLQVELNRLQSQ